MWIRYIPHNTITEQQQVWQHRFGALKYIFPRETGICFVPNKRHIYELLTIDGSYEIAHERYGVHFNEDGMEIVPSRTDSLQSSQSTVTVSQVIVKKLSKIQKMQEARNMARIARGQKPIEFKRVSA